MLNNYYNEGLLSPMHITKRVCVILCIIIIIYVYRNTYDTERDEHPFIHL